MHFQKSSFKKVPGPDHDALGERSSLPRGKGGTHEKWYLSGEIFPRAKSIRGKRYPELNRSGEMFPELKAGKTFPPAKSKRGKNPRAKSKQEKVPPS